MYSNGFINMMIYTHTINTSLESNNVNDDDAIDLITYTVKFNNLFRFHCKYTFYFKYEAIIILLKNEEIVKKINRLIQI